MSLSPLLDSSLTSLASGFAMSASSLILPGLMTPSGGYKPFRYPWAYDFWKKQQQVHWMP
jgi:ribonucleotide reductase beta subunit family protein with ferritin-like domain